MKSVKRVRSELSSRRWGVQRPTGEYWGSISAALRSQPLWEQTKTSEKVGDQDICSEKLFPMKETQILEQVEFFQAFFPTLHKHRRKHLDFTLQKLAKIHILKSEGDIQEKERREGRGEDVR